jgi:membrane protease YdiL (CAAX protease family)
MKNAKSVSVPETKRSQDSAAFRAVLPRLVRSPALWLFLAVYLLALALYLPVGGNESGLLVLLIYTLYYVLIALLVFPLTAGAPPAAWEEAADTPRVKMWVQLVVIAFFLALYLVLTVVIFSPGSIPGFGSFLLPHSQLTVSIAVACIPVVCLLPLVILRLLGVGFREMGLGRGFHAFRVAAVGCSVPVCALVVLFVLGHFTLPVLGKTVIQVFLVAALPEEVLFRGVLLTRLVRLLGPQWGIALAVDIFATMHLETDLHQYGSLPLALVRMVLTRSLLSGVVLHTVLDTFSIFSGL